MVAVPGAIPVTTPAELTSATFVSEDDQDVDTESTFPPASCTVAVSDRVSVVKITIVVMLRLTEVGEPSSDPAVGESPQETATAAASANRAYLTSLTM